MMTQTHGSIGGLLSSDLTRVMRGRESSIPLAPLGRTASPSPNAVRVRPPPSGLWMRNTGKTTALDGGGSDVSAAMSEHGEQLKQEMGDVVQTAKDQVVDLRETARTRIEEEVDRRRTELGTGARRIADATRQTSRDLRDEGKDLPAMLIDQASSGIDRAASYLEETDAEQVMRDLRDAGRRMPWLFVAAGVAVGFAASRVIKAAGNDDGWSGHRPEPTTDPMITRHMEPADQATAGLPAAPAIGETTGIAGSSEVAGS